MAEIRFRHIIWDWNGTLLDDSAACHKVSNRILRHFSKPELSYDGYRDSITIPVRDFWRSFGLGESDEEYTTITDKFHELYHLELEECRLHDGIPDLISNLNSKGLTQSILSAHPEHLLHYATKRYEIFTAMTAVIGVKDHTARGKIDVGKAWFDVSGIDPRYTLMVGDMEHDHEVAQALGINSLLISHGFQSIGALERTGSKVVHSLDELATYLGIV